MNRVILLISVITLACAKDWWENANYYQIYPRSYKDSNNDGIGDFQGIKSKVPYLKEIGINAVWLSPIMKSPMADHGYDISNYREVDPLFGNMDDFNELLLECQLHDIHLILDFVPNHSSNLHDWFLLSENKTSGYEDFYIWNEGIVDPNNSSNRLPPNNWVSIFRYSAWTWSDRRQAFYYHAFLKEQPDLNYRNPKVVTEMKEVLRFWLDKGVSGFRVDAVPNLFEVSDNANEPLSGNCDDPDSYCYHSHIYTTNQPETLDMVTQWRSVLDEYKDVTRIMMSEAYVPLDLMMKYFVYKGKNGSHIPFNFQLMSSLNINSTAKDIQTIAEEYLNRLPTGYSGNWVLGNHDSNRLASRLGLERADLYNILLQTLPGNAVTYQGEELVMTDGYVSWEETQDPSACNTNSSVYQQVSRDPCRTPFHWSSGTYAGFSDAKPWLPVASNYRTVNVETEKEDANSHLALFKILTSLHKEPALRDGIYESIRGLDDEVYAYIRHHDKTTYVVVLNFGKSPKTLNVARAVRDLKEDVKVVAASINSKLSVGTQLKSSNIVLPNEAGVVLAVSNSAKISVGIMLFISLRLLSLFI